MNSTQRFLWFGPFWVDKILQYKPTSWKERHQMTSGFSALLSLRIVASFTMFLFSTPKAWLNSHTMTVTNSARRPMIVGCAPSTKIWIPIFCIRFQALIVCLFHPFFETEIWCFVEVLIKECWLGETCFFPQIAIAIGVLTPKGGEGDEPLWRIGRGTRVPLHRAVDVVPLLDATVGCHCSVLWLGRVTTKFGGGGEGDDQLWGSGRGAIAGCHCSVLGEGTVRTNFRGWTWCNCWVVVCYGWGGVTIRRSRRAWLSTIAGCQSLSPRHPRKQQWILFWASCRRCAVLYMITQKLFFAIWGLCWYNFVGSFLKPLFPQLLEYICEEQVKRTKGFVLQVQQGVSHEKSHMQVAEERQSGWLNVPRIAVFAFDDNRDQIGGISLAKTFMETALAKAEEQWRNGVEAELKCAPSASSPSTAPTKCRWTREETSTAWWGAPFPTVPSTSANSSTASSTAKESSRMPRATSTWVSTWLAKIPVKLCSSPRIARRPCCWRTESSRNGWARVRQPRRSKSWAFRSSWVETFWIEFEKDFGRRKVTKSCQILVKLSKKWAKSRIILTGKSTGIGFENYSSLMFSLSCFYLQKKAPT